MEDFERAISKYFGHQQVRIPDLPLRCPPALIRGLSEKAFYLRMNGEQVPLHLDIIAENIVGAFPKEREAMAQHAVADIEQIIRAHNPQAGAVARACYVTRGSTQPLYAQTESGLSFYIKQFDPVRLFGLELYTLLGEIGTEYPYSFNDTVIVEGEIEGDHISDPEQLKNKVLNREIIKHDAISFFTGLEDIAKFDNYVVKDGEMRVIDFDNFDGLYDDAQKDVIKQKTAKYLGLTRKQYDDIFMNEERFLHDRTLAMRPNLVSLVDAFHLHPDDDVIGIADYVQRQLSRLDSAYGGE